MGRKEEMAKIHEYLVSRQSQLQRSLAGDLIALKELPNKGDAADDALASVHDDISSQLAEVESQELKQVGIALERWTSGYYGTCEDCNKNIAMVRLEALPYATRCIDCQREWEENGVVLAFNETRLDVVSEVQ